MMGLAWSWAAVMAPTLAAESFVSPLTLEVLSGERVYGQNYLSRDGGVDGAELHVEAARWADLLCVAPATANTLARLSLGLADDFLSTTALMFEGPVVVAPAMHDAMWCKPQVGAQVEALRSRGAEIVGPVEGALASGERGWGRMAEPEDILASVSGVFDESLRGLTVLVTARRTPVPGWSSPICSG